MKRDWDVMRMILVRMEEDPSASFQLFPRDFGASDGETVAYHLRLLKAGGYIEGHDRNLVGVQPADSFIATGMTLQGHDLIDTMKSKTVWARVKEMARVKGIELTFDAVKLLSGHAIKSLL